MSDLESALWNRITEIIYEEKRCVDYIDFVPNFKTKGQRYTISYGTFRNLMSLWVRSGKLIVKWRSPQAYYILKEFESTTIDPTGVEPLNSILFKQMQLDGRRLTKHPMYKIIQNLPFNKNALHDIHLRFEVEGIWNILSHNSVLKSNPRSKDIPLNIQNINNLDLKVTVHHTDTVSIIIGCSYAPIAVDVDGVTRLTSALTNVAEHITNLTGQSDERSRLNIPSPMSWIVTLWHFGSDSLITYTGEMFFASWEIGHNALIAVYTKVWKNSRSRIRKELQECPNEALRQALERLDMIGKV